MFLQWFHTLFFLHFLLLFSFLLPVCLTNICSLFQPLFFLHSLTHYIQQLFCIEDHVVCQMEKHCQTLLRLRLSSGSHLNAPFFLSLQWIIVGSIFLVTIICMLHCGIIWVSHRVKQFLLDIWTTLATRLQIHYIVDSIVNSGDVRHGINVLQL